MAPTPGLKSHEVVRCGIIPPRFRPFNPPQDLPAARSEIESVSMTQEQRSAPSERVSMNERRLEKLGQKQAAKLYQHFKGEGSPPPLFIVTRPFETVALGRAEKLRCDKNGSQGVTQGSSHPESQETQTTAVSGANTAVSGAKVVFSALPIGHMPWETYTNEDKQLLT